MRHYLYRRYILHHFLCIYVLVFQQVHHYA
nr:MAG TPA: hypothetical protein [Caudoviricetes sp.]DAY91834.1 MAG TPA: hypothetical protein [Caudoviricetes sp.]